MPNQVPNRYKRTAIRPVVKRRKPYKQFILLILLILLVGGAFLWQHEKDKTPGSEIPTNLSSQLSQLKQNNTKTTPPAPVTTACSNNTLSANIIVSISQQHLWACTNATVSYDSAVVTGMEQYPADLTPTGTYHIYGKQTDTTLAGHDSTGSWSDPVSYWMPFLDNQYGQYGFHDATWRSASDFGNININSPFTAAEHGSHGCVELPLATAKWLYGWASIGTTVTVEA
jgi:hypothetical protein